MPIIALDDGDRCTVSDRCMDGACIGEPMLDAHEPNGKDIIALRRGFAFATRITGLIGCRACP